MKKPSDIEVIQKLGGVKSISEILGVPYTTVNNWKSRGSAASAKLKYPEYFMPRTLNDIKPFTKPVKPKAEI